MTSACGIEAVYMCFNETDIWGGETISRHKGSGLFLVLFGILQLFDTHLRLDIYI